MKKINFYPRNGSKFITLTCNNENYNKEMTTKLGKMLADPNGVYKFTTETDRLIFRSSDFSAILVQNIDVNEDDINNTVMELKNDEEVTNEEINYYVDNQEETPNLINIEESLKSVEEKVKEPIKNATPPSLLDFVMNKNSTLNNYDEYDSIYNNINDKLIEGDSIDDIDFDNNIPDIEP